MNGDRKRLRRAVALARVAEIEGAALEQFGRVAWMNASCADAVQFTQHVCTGNGAVRSTFSLGAYLAHAHILTSLGRPDEALAVLDSAESLDVNATLDTVVSLLQERAYTLARLGREEEALANYRRAAEFARHRTNSERAAVTLNNFAVTARNVGHMDLALELHREVASLLEKLHSYWRSQYCLASHGLTRYFAGDLEESRSLLLASTERPPAAKQVALAQASLGVLLGVAMGDDALTSQFAREDILEASFRSGEPYRFAAMSAAMHQYYVRKGEANKARALLGRCSKAISNPEGCSLFTLEVAKHGDAALVARTLEQNELLNVESRVRQGFEYLLHASAPAIGRELDALQQADRAASIFGDLTWPLHRAVALERAERYGEAANVYLTCGATVYARAMRRRRWHVGRPRQVSGQLTARQWEVAKLCQAGLRNHEIASRMGITLGTVEFHVHNVLRELNVTSRHELRALLLQGSESR